MEEKGYTKNMIMMSLVVGFCLGIISSVGISQFNSDCISNETLFNQTIQAYQYGAIAGINYTINAIGEQAVQCEEVPLIYQDKTYSIIAVECLELNNEGGK